MWQIALTAPRHAISIFEKCLEPFVEAIGVKQQVNHWLIRGYSTNKPNRNSIENIVSAAASRASVAHPLLQIHLVPDMNWTLESIKGLDPIVVGRFLIYGSYNDPPKAPSLAKVKVDAGEAFGTGHHATTKGCLLALSLLQKTVRPARILDLGCGAGTLAIASAKLWKTSVLASDIDQIAIKVATKNIKQNKRY